MNPKRAILRSGRADLRPSRADSKPRRANLRPERADFKPVKADMRPERAYLRPERADLRPERADLRPGRGDKRKDGRTKVPLCSTGLHPLQGHCPKSDEGSQSCCGRVGRGFQPPSTPQPPLKHTKKVSNTLVFLVFRLDHYTPTEQQIDG